ncbi:MAG TPA: M23 family metallopeptidase [Actinomycetota bacterium]|nr:M23 family metallopeptidase [Actinomycetota bacterium]
MLPAVALEGVASRSSSTSFVVPIPQEHIDVIVRPKPKAKSNAKPSRVVARNRNIPHAKKPRSTPALRLGFSWPVTKNVITSPFGWRPFVVTPGEKGPHPAREFHHGMDIACSLDQPVTAAKGGRVILAGTNNLYYGKFVVIQHAGGWSTLYGHLDKLRTRTGREVSSGALIGLCGSTGRADGVHLHFEVRHLGSFFNPIYFLP